jgi:hypothetical protein
VHTVDTPAKKCTTVNNNTPSNTHEKIAILLPIQRIIGGIHIQYHLGWCLDLGLNTNIHHHIVDLLSLSHNLLVAAVLVGSLRR